MYLLSVPSVSSRYFNKIKRTSYLGKLPVLSLEILLELLPYVCVHDVNMSSWSVFMRYTCVHGMSVFIVYMFVLSLQ